MAKHKKHIDDFFKDHLGESSLPLSGGEWDAIAKELHPKKKRFIWWVWLLPALLAGAALFYFAMPTDMEAKMSNVHTSNKSTNKTKNLASKAPLPIIDSATEVSKSNELPDNEITAQNEVAPSKTTHNGLKSASSKPIQESENILLFSDNGNIKEHNKEIPILKEQGLAKESYDLNFDNYETLQDLILYSKNNVQFDVTNACTFIALTLSGDTSTTNTEPFVVYPPKGPKGVLTNLQIGFTVNGLLNNQKLQSTIAEGTNYTNFRDKNEHFRYTTAYNLEFKTSIKHLTAGTGVSYLIKGQNLNKRTNKTELTYQVYDSIPYVDIGGDTTYLPFNYRDTSITGNFTNPTYNYLNIPLKLGKTFYINNRISIETLAELRFGYLFSTSGNSLNNAIKPTQLDKSEFNRFNLGTGASVGINYKLKNNVSLNINANFNTDLNNSLKQAKTSQKFTLYGLGVGVFYSINNK